MILALIQIALLLIPSWGVVLLALLTPRIWSTLHEAMHSHTNYISKRAARLLAIGFGATLENVTLLHLAHHRHNRTVIERVEMYDPSVTPKWKAMLGYYVQLLGGLYFIHVLCVFVFSLPKFIRLPIVRTFFGHHPMSKELSLKLPTAASRIDSFACMELYTCSFFLYYQAGLTEALITMILLRAFVYSYLDYVYHYGSPTNDKSHAFSLSQPEWLSRYILRFNYHQAHHKFPDEPWDRLVEIHKREGYKFDNCFWEALKAQMKGPIAKRETASGSQEV